jgi:UDP-glucose/iron transport system permease protein
LAGAGEWVRLALGAGVLLVIAVAFLRAAGVAAANAVVIPTVRAAVQLGIVAAALRGVLTVPAAVVGVIGLMFAVATSTAVRRLRSYPGGTGTVLRAVVPACAAGSAVAIGLLVGAPILDRSVRDLVAVSGIVIGGTMTAATLTGRRLLEGLHRRREEIEAWLALGATPRQAVRDIARSSIAEALVPASDQTRNVGLVSLPGAFVGALLGGAGAADAARFQFAVLLGLLCAESITAVLLAYSLGAPATLPEPASSPGGGP